MRFMDRRLVQVARRQRGLFVLTVGLGFGAGLITVVQAFLLAWILDAVFLGNADLAAVYLPLALLLAATLFRAGFTGGERAVAHSLAIRLTHELRRRVLNHLEAVGPIPLGGERSGEIQTTLGEGLKAVHAWFADYLPQVVLSTLVPLMVAAIVLTRDLLSAAVLLLTAPLIPLFMVLIANLVENHSREKFAALARLGAFFLDVLQGLTTLKILGRSAEQVEAVRRITDELRHTTMGVLRLAFLSALTLELLATLSVAVVAVEVGLRLLYGNIQFRDAFFVLVLAPEFYNPLRMLGQRFHAGMEGVAAADRLFGLLDLPTLKQPAADAAVSMPSHPTLELRGVHLKYPGRLGKGKRPALRGVDLRLEPGETVALVGISGAGKSTVANLLLRFLDPDSGEVSADGVPAFKIAANQWRERLAWVPQEPHMLADTVLANIRIGRPKATALEIQRAAREARAEEFIENLPNGWKTEIGERGACLSGGQIQRLALARAFLRDAPILILDEPGAGLDPLTLTELDETTAELLQGRTALVIAHRPAAARRADRVAVMEDGRIVQQGSYDELTRIEGAFSRLLTGRGSVL